jgi:AraC-like DNA-binding protein
MMGTPSFTVSQGQKLRGKGLPMHKHREGQLTFATSGVVQIHTKEGRWLAPPLLAVWVPAGVEHMAEVLTDAELRIVHCQPEAVAWIRPSLAIDRAFAVRMTPLLAALLEAAFVSGVPQSKIDLLGQLMLYELAETVDAPTFLPMPSSAVALRVAELAIDDPKGRFDLHDLATQAATSERTASRLFPAETGLTFKGWRQRARIVHAIDRLGSGLSIARVASVCGFSSTAAFSAAFRQVTRMSPTEFLRG